MPIVEGQSEERSVGVLLRRMLGELDIYDVKVARPFRVKRTQIGTGGRDERAVTQAVRSRSGASAVLVMLDADRDCPATLAPELIKRGEGATTVPVRVVLPKVETEAWILAAIESVRGQRGIREDAECPPDPESVRDAKGALSARMVGTRGYVATDDQPALLSALDLSLAALRSPSFAKLQRDLASLVQ